MKVIKCRLKAAGGVLQGEGTVYAKVIDAGRIDAESLVDMMAANTLSHTLGEAIS